MKKYIHVPTISVLTMGERKYTIKIEKRKNSCTRLELEVISYIHTHTHTHKLKLELPYEPAISLLVISPFLSLMEMLHAHSYTSMCCIAHKHSLGEICPVSECSASKALVSDLLLGAIKQFSKIDVLV